METPCARQGGSAVSINCDPYQAYQTDIANCGLSWDQSSKFIAAAGPTFPGSALQSLIDNNQTWYGAGSVLKAYAASVVSQESAAPVSEGTLNAPLAIQNTQFNQTVFHFCDDNANDTIASYTATITLGDGNTVVMNSSGVISGPAGASGSKIVANANGGFDVQLTYTYAAPIAPTAGKTFQVTVSTNGGATTTAPVSWTSLWSALGNQ